MDQRDQRLWRIAVKRAKFRKSAYAYIVVNIFLWAIWWFIQGRQTGLVGWPWPVWVMLGWGIGLAFQYFDAYEGNSENLAEREYEKLKRNEKL